MRKATVSQEVRSSSREAEAGDNTCGKYYIPKRHLFSIPTDRDRAYTFLCKSRVSDVRKLAKLCSPKQESVKNTIISNLMISASAKVEKGESDWIMIFAKELTEFWVHWRNQYITCFISPTDDKLVRYQPQTRTNRMCNSYSGASGSVPYPRMAAFEFPRLIGILPER